ncbi:hypothetical protein EDB92DRAFT_1881060, partial [Lactarius akahatsu]
MHGLCLLGQMAMTLCRGALGLSEPTCTVCPEVGKARRSVAVFEPAKVLVRGLLLPRPLRLPRPFREPTSLTTYQGIWPSIAR